MAGISLAESADSDPALQAALQPLTSAGLESHLTLANYRAHSPKAASGSTRYPLSLGNAGLATLLCLLVGYPVAFAIARLPLGVWRNLLLFLVILPFWTSFLIRVDAGLPPL